MPTTEMKVAKDSGKVSYTESPLQSIAKIIEQNGYQTASLIGEYEKIGSSLPFGGIGILDPRVKLKRGIIFKEIRDAWPGTLWLSNKERGAVPDKNWIMEVHGRDYIGKMKELAEEISSPFGVDVDIRLSSEELQYEALPMDFSPW